MVRVAVVTGANQGIGFAIVRALCKQFDGVTYLTARNTEAGLKAVEKLKEEGLNAQFHQLDITDKESISKLKDYLLSTYGGLDILINNAAILYKPSSVAPLGEQAEGTMRTNYWSLLAVCDQLFPILRSHARVVNLASLLGQLAFHGCSQEMKNQLLNCKSVDEVGHFMNKFVQDAKEGVHQERGWADSDLISYKISKTGVILVTKLQQADIDKDTTRQDIIINACCPGYVSTSMSDYKGFLTPDQGAITPVYCALLAPGVTEPRGEFLSNKTVVSLTAPVNLPPM